MVVSLSDLVSTEHKRAAEAHQGSNDTDKMIKSGFPKDGLSKKY